MLSSMTEYLISVPPTSKTITFMQFTSRFFLYYKTNAVQNPPHRFHFIRWRNREPCEEDYQAPSQMGLAAKQTGGVTGIKNPTLRQSKTQRGHEDSLT